MSSSATIYQNVSDHYGSAATATSNSAYSNKVAAAFGYSPEDLAGVAEDSNLGLSCGNPIALAGLREGERVVDLGCGAGFDVFQAAKKVGSEGEVVGVDFNPDMLTKAESIKIKMNVINVRFVDSKITDIPALSSGSVDCIISNCVVNLVPDEEKPLVFQEMHRLLKSGGRVAVSDILAKGPLPAHIRESMALYVGCIAGASQKDEYEKWLKEAGFRDIAIVDAKSDLNVYGETSGGDGPCCGPPEKTSCCGSKETSNVNGKSMAQFKHEDFNLYAGSYKIYAVKA